MNTELLNKKVALTKGEKDRIARKMRDDAFKIKDLFGRADLKLKVHGIKGVKVGPMVVRYSYSVDPTINLDKLSSLKDNISLALSTPNIRILTPVPGKPYVGVEVPRKEREIITLREMLESEEFRNSECSLPIALGKSSTGETVVKDLAKAPHLLIAGATGAGKSVCVNSIIMSLIQSKTPDEVKFIMIDPKMVELSVYDGLPYLMHDTITDPTQANRALSWAIREMESRYRKLKEAKARSLASYNEITGSKIPYIIIVIDEFADLMAIARKEVEKKISRLAAMARAVGIHLVLATQRPSVDVITGTIKNNFPTRIAFKVPSHVDSRTIIDASGAEQLLGRGDMLFLEPTVSGLARIQCSFLTDTETGKIVSSILRKRGRTESVSFLNSEKPKIDTTKPPRSRYTEDERKKIPAADRYTKREIVKFGRMIEEDPEGTITAHFFRRKLGVSIDEAWRILDLVLNRFPSLINDRRLAINKLYQSTE